MQRFIKLTKLQGKGDLFIDATKVIAVCWLAGRSHVTLSDGLKSFDYEATESAQEVVSRINQAMKDDN